MKTGGYHNVDCVDFAKEVLVVFNVLGLILLGAKSTAGLTDVYDADEFGLGELIVNTGVVHSHIACSDYTNFDWFQDHASFDPLDPASLTLPAGKTFQPRIVSKLCEKPQAFGLSPAVYITRVFLHATTLRLT
jgi:hypothetical protein